MNKRLIIILLCIAIFSLNAVSANEITNETSDLIAYPNDGPSIQANDIVKTVGNSTQYEADIYDDYGNPAYNQQISLEVNGVTYYRTTDSQGHLKFNINLMPGQYSLKATNPSNGDSKYSYITILPNIVENHDLTKYYRNASQYTVRLIGPDGSYATQGTPVTYNINGVFYTRFADANGYVTLNINLNPGTYIITAQNGIYQTSNTITVLSTLYEYGEYRWNHPYDPYEQQLLYRDGYFRVVPLDGQGNMMVGAKVTFNINGVFYDRYSSEAGVARLNINLNPGEYIITSEFNGLMISHKIIVIPNPLYTTIKGPLDYEYSYTDWQWSPQYDDYVKFVCDVYYNSGMELSNVGYYGEKYIVYDSSTHTSIYLDENGRFIFQEYMG